MLDDIDLDNRRSTMAGCVHLLDDPTMKPLPDRLDHRRTRWPSTWYRPREKNLARLDVT
ncbi:hypothetical protein ACFCV8_02035 [Streptomyces sp. NPDC056347]|uniref:hypothetical protein n=1 Tax=Streptomyces sp. NPDC056347 TaxID=3345790 RepID=UPI0035DBD50E